MSDIRRDNAARLFALAMKARDAGNDALADLLVAAATDAFEDSGQVAPPQPSPGDTAVVLQQQQIQPDDDDPSKSNT